MSKRIQIFVIIIFFYKNQIGDKVFGLFIAYLTIRYGTILSRTNSVKLLNKAFEH